MKNLRIEALIIAAGMIAMGLLVKLSFDKYSNSNRVVTVKGVSEMEVNADHVTWPMQFAQTGNDLVMLYESVSATNKVVVKFLTDNGIKEDEISIAVPHIYDNERNNYTREIPEFRYVMTSNITVSSSEVDLVRQLVQKQSELIGKGIAIQTNWIDYRFTGLNDIKPPMIEEATKNARQAAEKFAQDSQSKLGKIKRANQGQFTITDRDNNTSYIKRVRVVTTIDYMLED